MAQIIGFQRTPERLPDPRQPGQRGSRFVYRLVVPTKVALGQATEFDFARAITPTGPTGGTPEGGIALGRALESDVAFAIAAVKGAAAPSDIANRVAHARYTLEVAWAAHAQGAFVIGISTVGGTDGLAVSPFDVTFTGPNDILSDRFHGATIRRGRDDSRTFVLRGEATISVKDPSGLLNPLNPTSPIADVLQTRYQHVRLAGVSPSGAAHPLFYGFLERIVWRPWRRHSQAGIATLVCKDLLLWLSEARPIISPLGSTTTGAAIGAILDSIGWVDPTARSLDDGDTIPDFSADGSKTAFELISDLLVAERGIFFVDGAGVAVFEDRVSRTVKEPVAVIADEMKAAVPAVDHGRLRNRVRVTRTQTGHVATALDEASRTLIGNRDLEDIETAYLDSDSQADALASFILAQLGQPLEPLRDLAIDNRTEELLAQCRAREVGDVVTVSAAGAGIVASDFIIENLEHKIQPIRQSHDTTWLLSQHETLTPFRIGVSTLAYDDASVPGGTEGDVLVY